MFFMYYTIKASLRLFSRSFFYSLCRLSPAFFPHLIKKRRVSEKVFRG